MRDMFSKKYIKKAIIFLTVTIIFSCSENHSMEKAFKEAYSSNMKDPDSYELVSFEKFQDSYKMSEENKQILDGIPMRDSNNASNDEYDEVLNKLVNIELVNNEYFMYSGYLVKIRGKNSFGAKVISDHIAYYDDLGLRYIDGNFVYENKMTNP